MGPAPVMEFSLEGDRSGGAAKLALRREDRVPPERSVQMAQPEFIAGWEPMRRRGFLSLVGAVAGSLAPRKSPAQPETSPVTLLNAPLELTGDWGKALPSSAATVISRMREVSLAGVRLLSDRQPSGLRVEDRTSGPRTYGSTIIPAGSPGSAWTYGEIVGASSPTSLVMNLGMFLPIVGVLTVNHGRRANGWRKASLRHSLSAAWESLPTAGNSVRSSMMHRTRTPFGNTGAM